MVPTKKGVGQLGLVNETHDAGCARKPRLCHSNAPGVAAPFGGAVSRTLPGC